MNQNINSIAEQIKNNQNDMMYNFLEDEEKKDESNSESMPPVGFNYEEYKKANEKEPKSVNDKLDNALKNIF